MLVWKRVQVGVGRNVCSIWSLCSPGAIRRDATDFCSESLCHTVDIIGIGHRTRIATVGSRKIFFDTAASGARWTFLQGAGAPSI